jgi:hypothetical protein
MQPAPTNPTSFLAEVRKDALAALALLFVVSLGAALLVQLIHWGGR